MTEKYANNRFVFTFCKTCYRSCYRWHVTSGWPIRTKSDTWQYLTVSECISHTENKQSSPRWAVILPPLNSGIQPSLFSTFFLSLSKSERFLKIWCKSFWFCWHSNWRKTFTVGLCLANSASTKSWNGFSSR